MNRIIIKKLKPINPSWKNIFFRFPGFNKNNFPVEKPASIIPSQGKGGYAITNVVVDEIENAPGTSKGDKIDFITEPFSKGIKEKALWQKIIPIPIVATNPIGVFSKKLNTINPTPIAAMTSKMKTLKWISKNIPKLTKVNSRTTNHIPLDNRNCLLAITSFLFLKERKAEVPAKNTNTGAQK
jgi:hypothetical protein